ncbi:MAG TPA: hypothetical protein PKD90_10365 [Phnomibacter sp.]|nr:hypothetical protein [Phnomibacter sp.]
MENPLLCYDDHCPLCNWYSGMFVKHGMLPAEGRLPLSKLPANIAQQLSPARMHREIPLVDTATGKTLYGVEALVAVLSKRWPVMRQFVQRPLLFRWAQRLYLLVSYNRAAIVAYVPAPGATIAEPLVHTGYQGFFVSIIALVGGLLASLGVWLFAQPIAALLGLLAAVYAIAILGLLIWRYQYPDINGLMVAAQAAIILLMAGAAIAVSGALSLVPYAGGMLAGSWGLLALAGLAGQWRRRHTYLAWLHTQASV